MHSVMGEDNKTGASGPTLQHSPHFKTPTHTLIRVRENQRRHRQRRRDYIASLEQRVQELDGLFAQAKAKIVALETKLNQWNGQRDDTRDKHAAASTLLALHSPGRPSTLHLLDSGSTPALQRPREAIDEYEVFLTSNPYGHEQRLVTSYHALDANDVVAIRADKDYSGTGPLDKSIAQPTEPSIPSSTSLQESSLYACQGRCPSRDHSLEAIPMPASAGAAAQTLQLPELRPEEFSPLSPYCEDNGAVDSASTTPCTHAYILIAQQNFRGLDEHSIKEQLWRGFRKPRDEKEDCRVETVCSSACWTSSVRGCSDERSCHTGYDTAVHAHW